MSDQLTGLPIFAPEVRTDLTLVACHPRFTIFFVIIFIPNQRMIIIMTIIFITTFFVISTYFICTVFKYICIPTLIVVSIYFISTSLSNKT